MSTTLDKLKMLGYKIYEDKENYTLAMTQTRGFISTNKTSEYYFEFDRAGMSIRNGLRKLTLIRGRDTDVIYVDSYGNILELIGKEYRNVQEEYFYEDERHWLFRKIDGSIMYMNKELGKKYIVPPFIHRLSNKHKLEIEELAPMCIILNEVYINFRLNVVSPIIGTHLVFKEYTTVSHSSGNKEEVVKWIDHKTGNVYRTYDRHQPQVADGVVKFTGTNIKTLEKATINYKL